MQGCRRSRISAACPLVFAMPLHRRHETLCEQRRWVLPGGGKAVTPARTRGAAASAGYLAVRNVPENHVGGHLY